MDHATTFHRIIEVLSGHGDDSVRLDLIDPASHSSRLVSAIQHTLSNARHVNWAKLDDGEGFPEYLASVAELRTTQNEPSETPIQVKETSSVESHKDMHISRSDSGDRASSPPSPLNRTRGVNVISTLVIGAIAASIVLVVGLAIRNIPLLEGIRNLFAADHVASEKYSLQQLGNRLLEFHDREGHFPESIKDERGTPLLSWRVRILPLLGNDGAQLYSRFRLDEPWDSIHNLKLIGQMPDIFRSKLHQDLRVGWTVLQLPTGQGTLFSEGRAALTNIADGPGQTIICVETIPARAVVWTSPRDFEFDITQPKRGLVSEETKLIVTIFDDGTPRLWQQKTPDAVVRNIFSPNDGRIEIPTEFEDRGK
jgi:hypothetical protein